MSGTTGVLLAHLPLLLYCGHLCLQGWGNTRVMQLPHKKNFFFSVKQLNLCQVLWFDDKNTAVNFGRVWSMFQLGRGTSSHKLPCFNAISKNWALQLLWWVCRMLE